MNLVHEFLHNAAATKRLQRRYYWTTTSIGFTGVFVGGFLLFLAAVALYGLLGVPFDAPIILRHSIEI